MISYRFIAILFAAAASTGALAQVATQQAAPPTALAAMQQKPLPIAASVLPQPAEPGRPQPAIQKAARRTDAQPAGMRQIRVEMSGGELIELARPAANVFIADPTIADVQAPSGNSIIVFGKKPGTTSLFALDAEGKPLAKMQVVVTYAVAELQHVIQQAVPNGRVNLSSTPTGIVLSGLVPSAEDAEKAREAASRFIGDKEELINQLEISGPQQVNLRVRVAEVQRQVTKQLGFNWDTFVEPGKFTFGLATGRSFLTGGGNIFSRANPLNQGSATPGSIFGNLNTNRAQVNTLIDALAEEGLITILAEPNLTAVSGQTASFLAGGEFPIPVAQAGASNSTTITIEFKQFGVSLDFIPTVLSGDRISLRVRPEVSQLSNQGAITLTNLTIPALSVRRAETTVELGSGDSFAIAGLIQNNTATDLNKYPGLGDLPVLGPLFRSTNFQRNESELVIIVTPYVVRPANAQAMRLPTDGLFPASDLERIFLGRLNRARGQTGAVNEIGVGGARLQGDAGFIIN